MMRFEYDTCLVEIVEEEHILAWDIFRISDGRRLGCGFYPKRTHTKEQVINTLKDRIDVEHQSEDPWGLLKLLKFYESKIPELSICFAPWPTYDSALIEDEKITIPVQLNGKVKSKVSILKDSTKEEVIHAVEKQCQNIPLGIASKIIFVQNKIINIITQE